MAKLNLGSNGGKVLELIADESTAITLLEKAALPDVKMYSPDEALCMLIDESLTQKNYQNIRAGAIAHGVNLYPAYENVSAVVISIIIIFFTRNISYLR